MGLLPLLFSFNGRINRAQYWLGTIGVNVVNWVFMLMLAGSSVVPADKNPAAALAAASAQLALVLPVSLAVTWMAMALQVKRFHDRGQSGWWSLLPLAPVVFVVGNVISAVAEQWGPERLLSSMGMPILALLLISFGLFINLGCLPGTDGQNKFGNPPGSGGGPLMSTPTAPAASGSSSTPRAASSLFGAQSAMDRAVAEHARTAAVRPALMAATATAPMRAAPAGADGSFGRKPAR